MSTGRSTKLKKLASKRKVKAQKFQGELAHYLSLKFPFTVEESEEEGKNFYVLSFPDLPGCWAEGETLEEAQQKLEEAKKAWICASLEEGLPIPEPAMEDEFSGKFLLRISPKLHMILSKNAEREGKSLNQYIRSILEAKENQDTIKGLNEGLTALRSWMQEEFNILSQRLSSLETSFNSISDSILESRHPYILTFGQTDAMEVLYGQAIKSTPSYQINWEWKTGQAFQKEEEAA
jgi:antitoxin HicB